MNAVSPATPPVVEDRPESVATHQNRLMCGPVQLVQVPLWFGAERRGPEQAPAMIDHALRARWQTRGDDVLLDRLRPTLQVPVPVVDDADGQDMLPMVAATCAALAETVESAITSGTLAMVLGGDHALSAGSISGATRAARRLTGDDGQPGRLGVIWIDTHGDLNTPENSPSGHIHGMPLAAMLGIGPAALVGLADSASALLPADVCLLGVRDLDAGERALIRDLDLWALTMDEWDEIGIDAGIEAALAHLESRQVAAVHVSFDVDVLDPTVLPATGTMYPGGLSYREAARVLRALRTWSGRIVSADLVELNPLLDTDGRSLTITTGLLATILGESMR